MCPLLLAVSPTPQPAWTPGPGVCGALCLGPGVTVALVT